jgi:sarcosine oxidase, subunit delta
MKLIPCPINGLRPAQEFLFGGEVREMPDPNVISDADWGTFVFCRQGEPGVRREWWYHLASGTWFVAERDDVHDVFIRTYLYGDSSSQAGASTCSQDQATGAASRPHE